LFLLLAESRKAKANGLGSNLTMDSIRADVSFEEFQQFLNRYGLENHVGELTKPGVISREEFEQIYALQDFVVMDGKIADYRSRDGRSSVGSVVLAELASMTADSIPGINVGTSGYAAINGHDYFTKNELAGWERAVAVIGYLSVVKKVANFGETINDAYKLSEKIHQTSEIAHQQKMKQVLDAVSGKNGQTAKGTGNGTLDCDCFTAGTKVTTADGEKPIEEIAVGDQVLAKDDVTGEMAYKEVEWLYQRNVEETYNITVGGEVITTTDEHPFWIVGKGWVESKELAVGDVLTTSDGKELAIEKIEVKKEHNKVYNFKVKDFHTYFVSNLGIWTHNRCDVTPEGSGNIVTPDTIRKVDNNILDRMETAGGHTLDRHVSKTNEELIKRAIQEDVEAATSFTDKSTAIKSIQENLRKNADEIAKWLNESDTGRKIFDVSHKNPVGKGVLEDKKQVIYGLTDSRVVLIRDSTQELGFRILTGFPIVK